MKVSINIFDAEGNLVKPLYNGEREPGVHDITWDGTTEDGDLVHAGTYYLQMDAKGKGLLARLVIEIE